MRLVVDATTLLLRSAGVKNYLHYWLATIQTLAKADKQTIIHTYPPGISVPRVIDHEKSAVGFLGTILRLGMVQFCNISRNPSLSLFLSRADIFHASQHTAVVPRCRNMTATAFDLSCWTA